VAISSRTRVANGLQDKFEFLFPCGAAACGEGGKCASRLLKVPIFSPPPSPSFPSVLPQRNFGFSAFPPFFHEFPRKKIVFVNLLNKDFSFLPLIKKNWKKRLEG